MSTPPWFFVFALIALASPAVLFSVLGLASLIGRSLGERAVARLTQVAVVLGLLSAVIILAMMLATGRRNVVIELGDWVYITSPPFHLSLKFVFDRLSVPFLILSFVLCGTVGAFASRYLHREPGFNRFFVLFSVFLLGMVVSTLAETIETLFIGWELVGLSSALLVAFFHERLNPVRNGLRVWGIYRIADAAFLIAALLLHHLTGAGDFDAMMGGGVWPEGHLAISPSHAFAVGLLLLVAAVGKSALVPFSGWLPRAMEGPTPSSAIFYGALSVHLGVYLLLRVGPLLDSSLPLRIAVVSVGLISAGVAALASRVQTDIKSALAFASMTQVGIIVVEIGCGLRYLALVHIIGHACLRTLQLIRAPSLLHDYHSAENAIGSPLKTPPLIGARIIPSVLHKRLYQIGYARAFLDDALDAFIIQPFLIIFRWCDKAERRWIDFLSGNRSQQSHQSRAVGTAKQGEDS